MFENFCGWYFKCQSDRHTLALIAAVHKSRNSHTCSIQVISDDKACNFTFPYEAFYYNRRDFQIRIGESCFGRNGIKLCLSTPDHEISGIIEFGRFTPIRYDIMGPFQYVPFMECRHSVVSIRHAVNGELFIDGVNFPFCNAVGYIEGDRGRSFPREYAWTHCFFDNGSIMLSVADIPIGTLRFTGVICVIRLCGEEYRLATYLGARAIKIENGEVVIRQGDTTLSAKLIRRQDNPLFAPVNGSMSRMIRESAVCRASYKLVKGARTLFDFESDKASFEYEYEK